MNGAARALGIFAISILAPGCERRTPQCNRLVDTINRAQAKMADILVIAGGPRPTAPSLEEYAKAHDDMVKDLRLLQLRDKKILDFRDRYVEIAQGIAEATRKTAVMLDTEEAQKAADEVKAFTPKKRALEKSVNDYCRGRDD